MNIFKAIQAVRDAAAVQVNLSFAAKLYLQKSLDELEQALNATPTTDDKVYDWAKWVERYYAFRRDVGSPVVKFLPADGKGLKEVQAYLVALTGGTYTEAAYQTFDYICSNWRKLTPFIQGMVRPGQMHKYLDEIILKLNPHGAGKTAKEAANNEREQYRRDLAERIAASAGGTPQAQRPEADTFNHNTDR